MISLETVDQHDHQSPPEFKDSARYENIYHVIEQFLLAYVQIAWPDLSPLR